MVCVAGGHEGKFSGLMWHTQFACLHKFMADFWDCGA